MKRDIKLEKFFDELNKKLFPAGTKQQNKEAQEIIKLSNDKLNFDESFNLLLGTSALFGITEDRSEDRIIEYINKKTNRKLSNEETKAIFDFITSKFFINNKESKISKEQFAEALYIWLSKNWNGEVIKEVAKDSHFEIRNIKDFIKISQELFFLNIWSVICACEAEFKDEDKRNECLDIFCNLIYKNHPERKTKNFNNWTEEIKKKCSEYDKALERNSTKKPELEISKLISRNLFEKDGENLNSVSIYSRIVFATKHLRELIRKFEIE